MGLCVGQTQGHVGSAHALQAVLARPLNVQKCSSVVLLKTLSFPFHVDTIRVTNGDLVWWWWVFLFFFFLFFFFLENYSLTLLVVGILTSVLIFFISNFYLDSFLKFYLFSVSSSNLNLPRIIFSNIILVFWISNFFSWSFCKVLMVFSSIFTFKLMILCFQFDPYCFNFYFFPYPLYKSYYSFQFHHLITILFLFFISLLIIILFCSFTNLIFFQFHLSVKYKSYFVF